MQNLNSLNNDVIALYVKGLEAKGYSKQEIAAKLRSVGLFMQWAYQKDQLQYQRFQHLKDEIAKYHSLYTSTPADSFTLEDQQEAPASISTSPIHERAPPSGSHLNPLPSYGLNSRLRNWLGGFVGSASLLTPILSRYVSGSKFAGQPRFPGIDSIRRPIMGPTNAWPRTSDSKETGTEITQPLAHPALIAGGIITLLVLSILGASIYERFFSEAQSSLAYPSTVTTPSTRIVSFQGRLTDSLSNPITTSTNMRFRLYDASSGGTTLYDSGTCAITPDQDGIVNVLVGSDCGSGISNDVFTENTDVYLGVTVGADAEMTPRQQIANVGYAINAETLQGLPPGRSASNIPYINDGGDLLIAATSPQIGSTYESQTFQVTSANAITVQSAGTGGVTLTATGSGEIKFDVGGANAVTIENGGQVAIGATSAAAELDVGGGTANFIDGTDDLLVKDDVEVDGDLYVEGSIDTTFTAGSVVFAGASGVLSQDNTNFYWDNTAKKLGIGTAPVGKLDVDGAVVGKALVILDETGNQNILTASSSGTTRVNITRDGQLELVADGSSAGLTIGAGNDIVLYHDGTDSILTTSTGDWKFTATDDFIFTDAQVTNIQLSDVDTTLPNSNTGIVDAINDAYNAAIGGSGGLWTDSGTTTYLTTTTDDLVIGGSSPLSSAKLSIDGDADQIQLVVQGNATQTANLTEWQNSAGTILSYIDAGGTIHVDVPTTTDEALILKTTDDNTTKNLFEVQNSSGDTPLTFGLTSNGWDLNLKGFNSKQPSINVTDLGGSTKGQWTVDSNSANFISSDLTDGKTANLELTAKEISFIAQDAVPGSATERMRVQTDGDIVATRLGVGMGLGDDLGTTNFTVTSSTSTNIASIIKAAASQTANLTEWQNSSGTALSWVDESGNLRLGSSAADTGALHVDGAYTGKALAILNETGDQDILTASASGTTRFRVATDGNIVGAKFSDITNTDYFVDPALTGGTGMRIAGSAIISEGASETTAIGNTTADAKLDVYATSGEQLRLTYTDGSVYTGFTVDSGGDLSIDASGGEIKLADTDTLIIGGHAGNVAYNVIGDSGDARDEAAIASDNDLYIGGDLEVDGTIYGNITGTITPGFTEGSVVFADSSGNLAQDNTNFFWDNTNNKLGIGDNTPDGKLEISGAAIGKALAILNETGDQDILTASASGVTKFTVDNSGKIETIGGLVSPWTQTVIVDPNGKGDYTTIAAAVSALGSGGKIIVMPGTYTEDFTAASNIFIEGVGADKVTIINASSGGIVINGTAAHVKLDPQVISSAYWQENIYVNRCENCNIASDNNNYAKASTAVNCQVSGLPLRSTGYCFSCTGTLVTNSHDFGTYLNSYFTTVDTGSNGDITLISSAIGTLTVGAINSSATLYESHVTTVTVSSSTNGVAYNTLEAYRSTIGTLNVPENLASGVTIRLSDTQVANTVFATSAETVYVQNSTLGSITGTPSVAMYTDERGSDIRVASRPDLQTLIARGASSQTANLTEWQNSSGAALSWVDESGNLRIGQSAADTGKLHVDGAYTGKALAIFNETGDQNILTASASGTTVMNLDRSGNLSADGVLSFGDSTPDGNAYNTIGTGDKAATEIADGNDLFVTSYVEAGGGFCIGSSCITDWTSGVGTDDQTLAEVLAEGNTTTGYDIVMSTTDELRFYDDDADTRIYAASDGVLGLESLNDMSFTSTNDGFNFTLGGGAGDDFIVDTTTLVVESDTDKVGIGELAPSAKLHILSDGANTVFERAASDYFTAFGFNSGDPYLTYYTGDNFYIGYGESTGGAPSLNTMVLTKTGNVGIGNDTPVGLLDLSGASTGKALAIFNETGDQNILTASASGTTVLNLDRSGNLSADGVLSFGDSTPDGNAYNTIGTGDKAATEVADGNDLFVTSYVEAGGGYCIGSSCITSWSSGGLWEDGTYGVYEDDKAVIVGADADFTYITDGVGDLRVASEAEILGGLYVGTTDYLQVEADGDLVFTDANDAASITGPAGGDLNFTSANDGFNFTLGGGAGDDFIVDTTTLVVESDTDRVGIGTAAPGAALEVTGDIYLSDGSDRIISIPDTSSAAYDLYIESQTTTGTTDAGDLILRAGDNQSFILGDGGSVYIYGGTGFAGGNVYIYGDQADTAVALAYDGTSVSGEVGVGTDSPESLFEIQGDEGNDATLTLDADQGDDDTDTWFIESEATGNDLSIVNHTTEVFNLTTGGNLSIDGVLSTGDSTPDGNAYNTIGTGDKAATEVADGNDLFVTSYVEAGGGYCIGSDCITSWSSGVGTDDQTLAEVLIQGNTTNIHNIVMSDKTELRFYDDDADTRIFADSDGILDLQSLNDMGFTSTNDGFNFSLGGGAGDDFIVDSTTLVVESDTDKVGIGTAAPDGKLHVTGAATGKALAIFNETGDQDILTASASGTTRLRLTNGGELIAGKFTDVSNTSYFIDPAATGGTGLRLAGSAILAEGASETVVIGDTTAAADLDVGGGTATSIDGTNDLLVADDAEIDGNLYVEGALYTGTIDLDFDPGSVVFIGDDGELSQDNSEFFWDNTNSYLGIGDNTPDAKLDVYIDASNLTDGYGIYADVYGGYGEIYGSNVYGMYSTVTGGEYVYGLYIGNIHSSVGYSKEYGIYVSDTQASNYFAGKVGIGNASPGDTLDVTGVIDTSEYYQIDDVTVLNQVQTGSLLLGTSAGTSLTTGGNYNTFAGYEAGYGTTTGTYNVALGYQAGYYNQTGTYNFFAGSGAGKGASAYTGSDNNIAIGQNSLLNIGTDVDYNIAFGMESGYATTTGTGNVLAGYRAGYNNQTGHLNTFIGHQAGNGNGAYTGSDYNVAIGFASLYRLTSDADNNVALGYSAGYYNSTGSNNIFAGYQAGNFSSTGSNNIFLGNAAGKGVLLAYTGADNNIAIGQEALLSLDDSSDNNIAIGYQAGYNVTSSDTGNIFLGYQAGYSETGSNKLYIENSNSTSPLIWGDFNTNDLIVNGDLGITTVTETLANAGFTMDGNDFFVAGMAGVEGNIYTDGSFIAGSTLTLSDSAISESGDLNFQPNGDADDYLYMNTTTNVPGLFWEGIAATDPGIYVSGTELGYRDETDSWVSFDSLAGGGSPGGSDTQIQYNNGGAFGGIAEFTYNDATGEITHTDDLTLTLAGTENFDITTNLGGTLNVLSIAATPSSAAGTAYGLYIDQVASANSDGFDAFQVIDNSDTDLAVADGILFTADGAIVDAIDASAANISNALNFGANTIVGTTGDIDMTNFDVTGSTGNITTAGDLAVNGDDITADGALTINSASYVRIGDTGTPGSANGDDDLYVEGDLEVDAVAYLQGNTTLGDASGDSVTINAATLSLFNASTLDLKNNSTTALNIESGLMDFDTANSRIGIGTTGPDGKLDVLATSGQQLRLTYTDGSAYTGFTVGSGGDLTIDATGNDIATSDRVTIGSATPGVGKLTVTGAEVGKALAIFNETGDQNIMVASANGTLSFSVTNNGDVSKGNNHGVNALPDSGSLVPNGSFEVHSGGSSLSTLPDGWSIKGTGSNITWTGSGTAHGDKYINMAANNETFFSTCIPIAGGNSRTYTLSYWAKDSSGIGAAHANGGIYTYTSKSNCTSDNANAQLPAILNQTVGTSWTPKSGTVIPSSGENWARVYIQNYTNNAFQDTLDVDGVLFMQSALNAGLDLAETYPIDPSSKPEIAEIVSMGSQPVTGADIPGIVKSSGVYDKNIFGVVSTQPGLLLDDGNTTYEKADVALKGRVPVLVTTENGPIRIGDPITSSSIPGVGMKATRSGKIIGYAMTEWTDPDPTKVDAVTVFVNPETYVDLSILTDIQNEMKKLPKTVSTVAINAQTLIADSLSAATATIDSLIVNRIVGTQATLTDAEIERLNAQAAAIQELEAERARIDNLESEQARIKDLQADSVTSGNVDAEDIQAGTITADTIDSQNVRELRERLEKIAQDQSSVTVSSEQLDAEVEEVQKYIAELTTTDSPEESADIETYQLIQQDTGIDPGTHESVLGTTITNANLETLTVTGEASMTSLVVADAFSAGEIFVQGNSLISLNHELKLAALERVDIMNGGVVITADGTLRAKGEIIAEKGIRTNTIKPVDDASDVAVILQENQESGGELQIKNTQGTKVAGIDASGSAQFRQLSLETYKEATSSAVVIAARDTYRQTGIYSPAIRTADASGGNGILPAGENDIIIFNENITQDSVVNLTPLSSTKNQQLYVDKVSSCEETNDVCTPFFRVALDEPLETDVTFNWLIVN